MKGTKRKKKGSSKRWKPERAFVVKLLPRKLRPILSSDRQNKSDDEVTSPILLSPDNSNNNNNNNSTTDSSNSTVLDRDCGTPERIRLESVKSVTPAPKNLKRLFRKRSRKRSSSNNSSSSLEHSIFFSDCAKTRCKSVINLCGWNPSDADLSFFSLLKHESVAYVTELSLESSPCITDTVFTYVTVLTSCIKLSLASCPSLTFSNILLIRNLRHLKVLNLSNNVNISDDAVSIVAKHCVALQKLNLSGCTRIGNMSLFAIGDRPKHYDKILELNICNCVGVDDTGILPILSHVLSLSSLNISGIPTISGMVSFHAFSRPLNVITSLNVSNIRNLHFSALSYLAAGCKALVELNVAGCVLVNDSNLIALGKSACAKSLKVLNLSNCDRITDNGITQLVSYVEILNPHDERFDTSDSGKRCTALESIDVSHCYHLSNESFIALANNCVALESIVANGVAGLSEVSVNAFANHRSLKSLKVCGDLVTKSDTGERFFGHPKLRGLLALQNLECLHLSQTRFDSTLLAKALSTSRSIRDLNLNAVTTEPVLRALLSHNIRVLNLSASPNFTEASLVSLLKASPDLEKLNVKNCVQVGNATLQSIISSSIKSINVAGNWRITNEGVLALKHCVNLERLNVDNCTEVTNEALLSLASSYCLASELSSFVEKSSSYRGLKPKAIAVKRYEEDQRMRNRASSRISKWMRRELRRYERQEYNIQYALRINEIQRNSAIIIQRTFRRYAAKVLVALMRREIAAQIFEERTNAALVIQRNARMYIVRKVFITERDAERERAANNALMAKLEKERFAATEIQRIARGYLAKMFVNRVRNAKILHQKLRETSALVIQTKYRQFLARSRFLKLRTAAIQIFYYKAFKSETRICAAIFIQCAWRRKKAFKTFDERKAYVIALHKAQEVASAKIARAFRAYNSRVKLSRMIHGGAIALQKIYRGFVARQEGKHYIISSRYERPQMPLLLLATNSIFTREFGMACRKIYVKAYVIASKLQALYRGWQGRIVFKVLRGKKRQRFYRRTRAAFRIQTFFRHCRIAFYKDFLRVVGVERNLAARRIQSTFRMWIGKCEARAAFLLRNRKERYEYILSLSKGDGSETQWKRWLLLQRGAVRVIVLWYRSLLWQRGWISRAQKRIWDTNATYLQAVFRGHHARLYAIKYRRDMESGALAVQRGWKSRRMRDLWRQVIYDAKLRKYQQEEDNRAGLISRKVTNRIAFDIETTEASFAKVIQRAYRTLVSRHVYQDAKETRDAKLMKDGVDRLAVIRKSAKASPILQADIWNQCFISNTKTGLDKKGMPHKVPSVAEGEALVKKQETLVKVYGEEYRSYVTLVENRKVMEDRIQYFYKSSKEYDKKTDEYLEASKPFATQAKELTKQAAVLAKDNKQLQREVIRLKKMISGFKDEMVERMTYDPVLYGLDVDRVLAKLDGHWSMHSNKFFGEVWESLVMKHGTAFDTEKRPDVDELTSAWRNNLKRAGTPDDDIAATNVSRRQSVLRRNSSKNEESIVSESSRRKSNLRRPSRRS